MLGSNPHFISLLPADLTPAEPSDLSRASLLELARWTLAEARVACREVADDAAFELDSLADVFLRDLSLTSLPLLR